MENNTLLRKERANSIAKGWEAGTSLQRREADRVEDHSE